MAAAGLQLEADRVRSAFDAQIQPLERQLRLLQQSADLQRVQNALSSNRGAVERLRIEREIVALQRAAGGARDPAAEGLSLRQRLIALALQERRLQEEQLGLEEERRPLIQSLEQQISAPPGAAAPDPQAPAGPARRLPPAGGCAADRAPGGGAGPGGQREGRRGRPPSGDGGGGPGGSGRLPGPGRGPGRRVAQRLDGLDRGGRGHRLGGHGEDPGGLVQRHRQAPRPAHRRRPRHLAGHRRRRGSGLCLRAAVGAEPAAGCARTPCWPASSAGWRAPQAPAWPRCPR